MKREYVRPTMVCETFAADEYVAACGDKETEYLFKCDAGNRVPGVVYLEKNGVEGLQESDQRLGGYTACGTEHKASSKDSFLKGYYKGIFGGETIPVIVWRGPNNNDTHCTTNLDMNSWETAKS